MRNWIIHTQTPLIPNRVDPLSYHSKISMTGSNSAVDTFYVICYIVTYKNTHHTDWRSHIGWIHTCSTYLLVDKPVLFSLCFVVCECVRASLFVTCFECVWLFGCVCFVSGVCLFIKLHITSQPGAVILINSCYKHEPTLCVRMCLFVRLCMYVCVCVFVLTYLCVFMCVYVCLCVCIY